MASEIEHKFLVRTDLWRPPGNGVALCQGYLASTKDRVVRVRVAGEEAYLTIKGATTGIVRLEFEYRIPLSDARTMLARLCEPPFIEKIRYVEEFAGHRWEVDVFHGDNEGLVVAELEVASESERFERPPWLGCEVSDDPRYFNSNLSLNPYKNWKDALR
jgi:adenylate cyclase